MSSMMEYKGYHAKIEYDAEDGVLVGKVFGICDTIIFDGETVKEIEDIFHQSIDDYIQHCAEIGKEPDKEFKGSFNIRIAPEIHKRLALIADDSEQSINQVVIAALDAYVNPQNLSNCGYTYIIREESKSASYFPKHFERKDAAFKKAPLRLFRGGSKEYGVNKSDSLELQYQ